MKIRPVRKDKIKRFFKAIYLKLFRLNDSPNRIAIGISLGVFVGIMPGLGLIAVLFIAFIFKVNRAGAILGTLFTNTWLSFATFLLAVKVGALTLGKDWHDIYRQWIALVKNLEWSKLLDLSVIEIALPVLIGYLIVSFIIAVFVYLASFIIVTLIKKSRIKGVRSCKDGS